MIDYSACCFVCRDSHQLGTRFPEEAVIVLGEPLELNDLGAWLSWHLEQHPAADVRILPTAAVPDDFTIDVD